MVGVETDKAAVGGDGHLVGAGGAQGGEAVVEPFLEDVRQRDQVDIRAGIQRVERRLGAASAATDEANAQAGVAGRMDTPAQGQLADEAASCEQGGGAEKSPTRRVRNQRRL